MAKFDLLFDFDEKRSATGEPGGIACSIEFARTCSTNRRLGPGPAADPRPRHGCRAAGQRTELHRHPRPRRTRRAAAEGRRRPADRLGRVAGGAVRGTGGADP
ncbi:hypothetical protein E4K10_48070 [Streptomyces sp. T1317-0309]|nr:hypothetical protein E4K10_48070 [Streptomyces sp. T1317-0309]